MLKIVISCIAGFLFFGWLPIAVGTYDLTDALFGGILGIIIVLSGFGIYEIKSLREEIHALKKELEERDTEADTSEE